MIALQGNRIKAVVEQKQQRQKQTCKLNTSTDLHRFAFVSLCEVGLLF